MFILKKKKKFITTVSKISNYFNDICFMANFVKNLLKIDYFYTKMAKKEVT